MWLKMLSIFMMKRKLRGGLKHIQHIMCWCKGLKRAKYMHKYHSYFINHVIEPYTHIYGGVGPDRCSLIGASRHMVWLAPGHEHSWYEDFQKCVLLFVQHKTNVYNRMESTETLDIHASRRLDYCSSLLCGLLEHQLHKLQRAMNACARIGFVPLNFVT